MQERYNVRWGIGNSSVKDKSENFLKLEFANAVYSYIEFTVYIEWQLHAKLSCEGGIVRWDK
jgi:hypothetical protein